MRRVVRLALLFVFLTAALPFERGPAAPGPAPGLGNPDSLAKAYARWQEAERRRGREGLLVLPLVSVKGLSARPSPARGKVILDLADGSLRAEVSGLGADAPLDLWIIDNAPDGSVRPGPGDHMVRLGRLEVLDGAAALETRLDPAELAGFRIDLVVAGAAGADPGEAGMLFGMPSLFQKLRSAAWSEKPEAGAVARATPFSLLVPGVAEAGARRGGGLGELVAKGEDLFLNETFAGNGRTCATCHPAEHNFTIDPEFIAGLPDDDPLFVAEFNPDLAEGFEEPKLMRKFGLILENVDGFENPGVMRGVPHTLALPTSMDASDEDIENGFPVQRTGWSADGAPGSGSLREFAIGAVKQHFPKTMEREEGPDFRLPTDQELDALEAFQLSLGRQEDPDLGALVLADASAMAGQDLFLGAGFCNACHLNAGANGAFPPFDINGNFDTDTEELIKGQRKHRPVDAGFGREPAEGGGFGNGEFNTPTLVEAADTPPFFHNNTVPTLEEAVAFYASDVFNDSPAGLIFQNFGGIELDEVEAAQIGAFLRVINALENVRSAVDLAGRAKLGNDAEASTRLVGLALADAEDAIEVLAGALGGEGVHDNDAVPHLEGAAFLLAEAGGIRNKRDRNFLIDEALAELEAARAAMVSQTT